MVVFASQTRLPIPIFNEKVTCGLGRDLGKTNQLNPEGCDLAIQTLKRFCGMAKEMQIDTLKIIATSAVREADDGKRFAKKKSVPYSRNKSIMASNDLGNNKVIPKTATNMPTYILLGLISVLLSLTIFFLNRKYAINKNI